LPICQRRALAAANGRVVGSSEYHETEAAREEGIQSLKVIARKRK
jgi:uncharacterized protein YegP (UPF0339 family)